METLTSTDQSRAFELVERLCDQRSLTVDEYAELIANRTDDVAASLARFAYRECERVYGDAVYVRALIEFTNYCANDCFYCGIRKGNDECERYRLSREQILSCAESGYGIGFRTFVLQGGEDSALSDARLCSIVGDIKRAYPDCAVTVSVGERSRASYAALREAGADRYLLRHETATEEHYRKLHPRTMAFGNRMRCLHDLRDLGFVVGAGFMVGSPYQTSRELGADLKFIEEFGPEMCGIGPFVPHHATPFSRFDMGTVELTCFLLSIIRIVKPDILLPATTALATIDERGYERGIEAGANVVMPNLSASLTSGNYQLYDGKVTLDGGDAQTYAQLCRRVESTGRRIVVDRGDPKREVV